MVNPTVRIIGFVVNGCYNDFANKYAEQIIRIAPTIRATRNTYRGPKERQNT